MNIAKDIVDKYTIEQIVAYLDNIMSGILQNYRTSVKAGQPQMTWGSVVDIAQAKEILHELKRRNDAREATKQDMV